MGREYSEKLVLGRLVPGHVPAPLHLSPLDAVNLALEPLEMDHEEAPLYR